MSPEGVGAMHYLTVFFFNCTELTGDFTHSHICFTAVSLSDFSAELRMPLKILIAPKLAD